jgi:hypothetical protein
MQFIQLQWGWAVPIVGAGLIIGSAEIKHETQENHQAGTVLAGFSNVLQIRQ